jgi:hypothetical protein
MGEARRNALWVGFNHAIKLESHGAKVSSDAGPFPDRDPDEAAPLTDSGTAELFDYHGGRTVQHGMTARLRQSVHSRLAGYEDVNDAERLSVDPVMRYVVGGRSVDRTAASTSLVGRFETESLAYTQNLRALMARPGLRVARVRPPGPGNCIRTFLSRHLEITVKSLRYLVIPCVAHEASGLLKSPASISTRRSLECLRCDNLSCCNDRYCQQT